MKGKIDKAKLKSKKGFKVINNFLMQNALVSFSEDEYIILKNRLTILSSPITKKGIEECQLPTIEMIGL